MIGSEREREIEREREREVKIICRERETDKYVKRNRDIDRERQTDRYIDKKYRKGEKKKQMAW